MAGELDNVKGALEKHWPWVLGGVGVLGLVLWWRMRAAGSTTASTGGGTVAPTVSGLSAAPPTVNITLPTTSTTSVTGNPSTTGKTAGSTSSGTGTSTTTTSVPTTIVRSIPPLKRPTMVTHHVTLSVPAGYQNAGSIQHAIAAVRGGQHVLYRNNTTGTIGTFVPGSHKTPSGATLFTSTTPKLSTPAGYTGASSIQAAIAAHRSGQKVYYRNNKTGQIGVFIPGSKKTPVGATLFVPTYLRGG